MSKSKPKKEIPTAIVIGVAVILLIAVVGIAGYLVVLGNTPAKTTSLTITAEPLTAQETCNGVIIVTAQLLDNSGNRIDDAKIVLHVSQTEKPGGSTQSTWSPLEQLLTDKNGKIITTIPTKPEWCGQYVDIIANFNGTKNYQPANAQTTVPITAATTLYVEVPETVLSGQMITLNAVLKNNVTGTPLAGKTVAIGAAVAVTDSNGAVQYNQTMNTSGYYETYVTFYGDDSLKSTTIMKRVEVLPIKCMDGTPIGQCTGAYICNESKQLEFSCKKCGCGGGLSCVENKCVTEDEKLTLTIEKIEKSDVKIKTEYGTGSGVIIANNGSSVMILTNRHVIDPGFNMKGAKGIEAITTNNTFEIKEPVFIAPNQLDLAVIVVNAPIGPAVEREVQSIAVGSTVLAIGSPLGIAKSVSKGIISNIIDATTESGYKYQVIQTDAALNPGNSGGGIYLASSGKLIGITTYKLVSGNGQVSEGLGFAIPVSLLDVFALNQWTKIT